MASNDFLLKTKDALVPAHYHLCIILDYLIENAEGRSDILNGEDYYGCEEDACTFDHGKVDYLNEESKIIMSLTCDNDLILSPPVFFYYLRLIYKRFLQANKPQSDKDEFTAGMEHFRNACKIKCDENGDPILEGYPHA